MILKLPIFVFLYEMGLDMLEFFLLFYLNKEPHCEVIIASNHTEIRKTIVPPKGPGPWSNPWWLNYND